ncbi:phage Gp37/Gp68 family protein [Streptomyces californicus]|uniref:phage Gp37/Gp68 family protein n=1 Tax=Streptomyces californicus TaxID=67351 RepID=UPI0037D36B9E
MTAIQWTEQTWNPTTGCDRISPGCDNCYALTMAKRLKGMGSAKYQTDGDPRTSGPGFGITTHPDTLTEPLRWKKPRKVFVNSMSDLFHARVPRDFLAQVFAVMAATPQHTYQILTKRPDRAARILGGSCKCGHPNGEHFRASMEWAATSHSPAYVPGLEHGIYHRSGWPLPNVWIGTSVENQKYADLRIPALLKTPAAVRFLSCEPLLSPVRLFDTDHSQHARDWDGEWICLDCSTDEQTVPWRTTEPAQLGIDWVIIGGESGPGARPFQSQWAASLIEDARAAGAAPFVKQLGTVWARDTYWAGKSVAAHGDTKGGDPTYWPANLRVREYPTTTEAPR